LENKYAFISYQTNDIDDAYWVKKVLIENGINCWMAPDSIPGGSSYADEIDDAINGCTVFVLVLSEQTQHSKWVKKELDRAINTGKLVLPFMIENIQLEKAFNFYLTDVQRYSAFESKVSAVEKMVKHIQAVMGVSSENPSEATTVILPSDPKQPENKAQVSEEKKPAENAAKKEEPKDEDLNLESLYRDAKGAFDKMKESKFMPFVFRFTPYNKPEVNDAKVKYALDMTSIGWGVAAIFNVLPALFSNIFSLAVVIVVSFLVWHGLFFICKKVANIEKNYKILAPVICTASSFIITQFVLTLIRAIF
jgi:hypothetical protein